MDGVLGDGEKEDMDKQVYLPELKSRCACPFALQHTEKV